MAHLDAGHLLYPQMTALLGLGREVKKGRHTLSSVSHLLVSDFVSRALPCNPEWPELRVLLSPVPED